MWKFVCDMVKLDFKLEYYLPDTYMLSIDFSSKIVMPKMGNQTRVGYDLWRVSLTVHLFKSHQLPVLVANKN